MRKTFMLLLLSFITQLCFAQLPNELMGIQVGFSIDQADSVISSLNKVKVKVDKYNTIEVSGKLIFDEIKWNVLRIRTYNDKVVEVQLEKTSKMSSLSNEAHELMDRYKDRYMNYYEDLKTNQDVCFESIMKFKCCNNRKLHISYYICGGGSLYLTCSRY